MSRMPREYTAHVKALLAADESTAEHRIGRTVWELSRRGRIRKFLDAVMDGHPQATRPHEIAWELGYLMRKGWKS